MSTPSAPADPTPTDTIPGPGPAGIDPRGPRVGAGITAALLAVTLLLGTHPAATVLLAVAAALFAVGALRGPQGTPQGWVFRTVVRPRLSPPAELEDPAPPRFAQLVGLVVTGLGLLLGLSGVTVAIPVSAGLAFVAAFLNAAFGLCLGCELYLLTRRLRPAGIAPADPTAPAHAHERGADR